MLATKTLLKMQAGASALPAIKASGGIHASTVPSSGGILASAPKAKPAPERRRPSRGLVSVKAPAPTTPPAKQAITSKVGIRFMAAIAAHFSDMRRAFQWVDLDGDGCLSKEEIGRALMMWNITHGARDLDHLFDQADANGDGSLSYKEFVNALAHDSVQKSTASWERADVRATTPEQADAKRGVFGVITPRRHGEAQRVINAQQGIRGTSGDPVGVAREALNSRFRGKDMRLAFRYLDIDRSGTISKQELERALALWNIPADAAEIDQLLRACDFDGSGQIDYNEFVQGLARDKWVGAQ